MKYSLIVICLIFMSMNVSFAQNRGCVWYFGHAAGLSFANGNPVSLTDGAMVTKEGCAAISDNSCNIIFYTDGMTVWNSKHKRMPNGFNLLGDSSATQAGVIIPFPENKNMYYVFSVDDNETNNGICFSIVDMRLDNGNGDITSKNTQLFKPATEKITAVKHKNGIDIWVIVHEWESNTFRSYLITKNGLNMNPVFSAIGSYHGGFSQNKIGYLMASPDGKKLACAIKTNYLLEIFDFDNSTGIVSNPISISDITKYNNIYGVGFSPDGSRLYTGTRAYPYRLYQFDMTSGSSSQIINSSQLIQTCNMEIGALQVGPDGKMYVALRNYDYLGVINKPNELGISCDFKLNGIYLNGRTSALGLPTFIQSYFAPDLEISSNGPLCEGDDLMLTANIIEGAEYFWLGPNKFNSKINNPILKNVTVSMSGKYELKVYNSNFIDTVRSSIDVIINPKPNVNISPQKPDSIIEGEILKLKADPIVSKVKYRWSTGDSSQEISVVKAGVYKLIAENEFGCIDSASVEVFVKPMPDILISSDKKAVICFGDSIKLTVNPYNPEYTYTWSNGKYGKSITVGNSGTFSVIAENKSGNISQSNSFIVFVEQNRLSIDFENKECYFDTTYYSSTTCKDILIKNISFKPFKLSEIYILENTEFSIPQSQFDKIIDPQDSIYVKVCFSSKVYGNNRDTLIIRDSCSDRIIPLSAFCDQNEYYSETDCNVIIKLSSNISTSYANFEVKPNPIHDNFEINYNIKNESFVNLSIYNSLGNKVEILTDGKRLKGNQSILVNTIDFQTGIYFIRLDINGDVDTKIISILK